MNKTASLLLVTAFLISCNRKKDNFISQETGERHLRNIQQLTTGGDNAEAYFSFDNKQLVFQSNNPKWGLSCDQIFYFDINARIQDTSTPASMLSSGLGRTTCSYFMPDGKSIVYASTHQFDSSCPEVPDPKKLKKYVWPIYSSYDIYQADLKGNIIRKLTDSPGYDAEATISPKGDKIVFTSDRSGDLELYTMDLNGRNVQQITSELGYDGGAFFSPDGKKLVFRASRPKTDSEISEYKQLLKRGLVAPTQMEIFTCNVDGSEMKQITKLGKANWCPFYHPNGKRILFSSNHHSKRGYDFQLYAINEDGSQLEQITSKSEFNAFPMFSFDGKKLVFSSNRNNGDTRSTNIFIADWLD